jgi:hypothetical protein
MKLNKLSKTTMSLATAMGALAMTTSTNAATPILSVDFNDTAGAHQAGFTAWDEGTGFSKTNVGGSGLDVTITGASAMHPRGAAVDGVDAGFTYANLYNDWLYGSAGPMDFSISGLDANTEYEITWYSYDNNGSVAPHTIKATVATDTTGDTLSFTPGSSTAAPKANDDFAFTGTWISTTGTLNLTAGATSGTSSRVNGFEISAVPEPTTTALLGLGGLALILRRRK